jgi:3-hydroxyacyl-CoA dehydrogenase
VTIHLNHAALLVVGAGIMGTGITQVAAQSGHPLPVPAYVAVSHLKETDEIC